MARIEGCVPDSVIGGELKELEELAVDENGGGISDLKIWGERINGAAGKYLNWVERIIWRVI